ncbi:MAG: HAD family phosphatase [Thermoleophilaceae bacterium]
MNRPKAIVSDFGGVLTTPLGNAFAAWSRESGIALEALGLALAASAERHGEHPLFVLERGELSEAEFVERLEREIGDGRSLAGMTETYFEHLERNHEMIDLMADLRGRGLRAALLTNNVREWEPRWRAMLPEIDEIFEVVVDSAFVGMRKPEHEIYHLTVERLGGGLRAQDCLFVDDIALNCDAARAVGMRAVVFETTEQARAEIELALA